jgi:hypothetical protein
MSTVWWFDNNYEKLEALRKEGYRQIETAIDARRIFVLFHLAMKPSFTNPAGYTVFYRFHADQDAVTFQPGIPHISVVRRIVWDHEHDFQRARDTPPWLFTVEPTLKIDELELNEPHFLDMLERVKHIAIPLVGFELEWALDGGTYELSQKQLFGSYHISWWAHGPATWRELTQWADDFINAVDVAIDGV